jgi:lipid-A-disaccharide synthase
VRAEFVGHPLADAIPLNVDRRVARSTLNLPDGVPVVALLPGSRRGEVSRLAEDFARTAQWLCAHRPSLKFIAPMASAATHTIFGAALQRIAPQVSVQLLEGQAQVALIASDVVLVTSGTASLEAALCKRPMVVVYRLTALTAWIVRRMNLVKSKFFAQPNLLADRRVVGEYFQGEIVPESIGAELLMWLDDTPRREELEREFRRIHAELKQDASARAAQAVMALLDGRRPAPGVAAPGVAPGPPAPGSARGETASRAATPGVATPGPFP